MSFARIDLEDDMTISRADIPRLFPYAVPISDPDEATKRTLTDWEKANRATEWRQDQAYAPEHNWTAEPGGGWVDMSSKTYFFESPQDADIFQRRFA
jgi:hypothetical protein